MPFPLFFNLLLLIVLRGVHRLSDFEAAEAVEDDPHQHQLVLLVGALKEQLLHRLEDFLVQETLRESLDQALLRLEDLDDVAGHILNFSVLRKLGHDLKADSS